MSKVISHEMNVERTATMAALSAGQHQAFEEYFHEV